MHTHPNACAKCGASEVKAILDPHGPRCAPCIDNMGSVAKVAAAVELDLTDPAERMALVSLS